MKRGFQLIVLKFALLKDNRSTDLPHIKKDTEQRCHSIHLSFQEADKSKENKKNKPMENYFSSSYIYNRERMENNYYDNYFC